MTPRNLSEELFRHSRLGNEPKCTMSALKEATAHCSPRPQGLRGPKCPCWFPYILVGWREGSPVKAKALGALPSSPSPSQEFWFHPIQRTCEAAAEPSELPRALLQLRGGAAKRLRPAPRKPSPKQPTSRPGHPARCPSTVSFLGGRVFYYNRQTNVGTLILTSLLEDLDGHLAGCVGV